MSHNLFLHHHHHQTSLSLLSLLSLRYLLLLPHISAKADQLLSFLSIRGCAPGHVDVTRRFQSLRFWYFLARMSFLLIKSIGLKDIFSGEIRLEHLFQLGSWFSSQSFNLLGNW
ncbi:unnamed protein product [Malus baccata var. baccata]